MRVAVRMEERETKVNQAADIHPHATGGVGEQETHEATNMRVVGTRRLRVRLGGDCDADGTKTRRRHQSVERKQQEDI